MSPDHFAQSYQIIFSSVVLWPYLILVNLERDKKESVRTLIGILPISEFFGGRLEANPPERNAGGI
jgi:hypothetical protein